MKKAIVDSDIKLFAGPFEEGGQIFNGFQLKQIENTILFPVGEPRHFWADCPDEANLDTWWYNSDTKIIEKIPTPVLTETPTV